jgi:aspartyl-tRNA synthetase
MQTTSKQEAIQGGMKHYYTGKPCVRGHLAMRRVSSMDCVECSKIRQQLDAIKKYKADHYVKNKNVVLKRAAENYLKNKNNRAVYAKSYYKINKKNIVDYQIQYKAKKSAKNPAFKLSLSIKASISSALKRIASTKGRVSTLKYVGCSLDELKLHIERQFCDGMTWDNRNEWHIDHIVPLATAKTEQDVIALNHFSNLRPLWAKDNFAKGAKNQFLI